MEQAHPFESPPSALYPSEDGKQVTETEYWQNYYEHEISYEWSNGILEEKPMPDEKGFRIYAWILKLLNEYFEANPIGRAIYLEIGFKINHATKVHAVRKPDLGVILNSNPVPFVEGEKSYHGCFDLCVESLSFSNLKEIKRDTVDKKKEYARTQVPEYFIFDSRGKETAFYSLNAKGRYEPIPLNEGVLASIVLPGLQFRVSDLEDLPEIPLLMDDPVYSSYVRLAHQAERKAKEQERQRADGAEKRVLELEARLKQLDSDRD